MLKIENINLKPRHVFIAGMISIPAFLFQHNLSLKWIQVALFLLLSALSGKRIRILPNVLMMTGIICANIIPPIGKVLFSILGFPITAGALANGLERSAVLIGMIYISRFALANGLMIPGKAGNILSLVFFYFQRILSGERLSRGNLIKKIDRKLIAVYKESENFTITDSSVSAKTSHTSVPGVLYLSAVVTANWFLFILSLLHDHAS